jgi:hypothetical protein
MKKLILAAIGTVALSGTAQAGTSDSLENVAAIAAAPAVCGYTINEEMVNIAVSSLFTDPSDLNPGGRHYEELQDNLQRIRNLTATKEGAKSFCSRVSRDLSAFFG